MYKTCSLNQNMFPSYNTTLPTDPLYFYPRISNIAFPVIRSYTRLTGQYATFYY